MSIPFDRDAVARRHVEAQLSVDPDAVAVYYLPQHSPEREIRLVVVNGAIVERAGDVREPVSRGVDAHSASAHRLCVVDASPGQWERIVAGEIALPAGWSLQGAKQFTRSPAAA